MSKSGSLLQASDLSVDLISKGETAAVFIAHYTNRHPIPQHPEVGQSLVCHIMPCAVLSQRLTGRLAASSVKWGEVTDSLSERSPAGSSSRCLLLFCSTVTDPLIVLPLSV